MTPNMLMHKFDRKVLSVHRLRCNIKSLAAEARIIRGEENRCGQAYRACLSSHRRGRLRDEARYAQLVLAFLRGRKYRMVENSAKTLPDVKRLVDKAKRYWIGMELDAKFAAWINEVSAT